MTDTNQPTLIGINRIPTVEDEWCDMPEYISEDLSPVQQITVSFASFADVEKFAVQMGMNVSTKTNSTWYPHRKHTKYTVGYRSEK